MPILLETRLTGYVARNVQHLFSFDSSLLLLLQQLCLVNLTRNVILASEAIRISSKLGKYGCPHVLIKGIAELLRDTSGFAYRKMNDLDILVQNPEHGRQVVMSAGYEHGVFDREGKWIPADWAEVSKHEQGHYELFPLTKTFCLNTSFVTVDPRLLTRYRIYKQDDHYITDLVVDIHHSLSVGVHPEWIQANTYYLPILPLIDDIWYSILKCYYEVVKGDSTNVQSVLSTMDKIQSSNFSFKRIARRMAKSEFLNEEALCFMYRLASQDLSSTELEEFVSSIAEKVKTRIVGMQYG
ncbi:MAG: nucleotidyltransferase family protein [Thermoflavifilum sp.]|nr:nucleotidyltransferase family protein [Thermoflavifilum sp.]